MLDERMACGVGPAGIDIAYERRGNPEHPTVLLVMGIAAQMVNWPEGFLDALVGRGLEVLRFDNRDSGHSTHLDGAPVPDLPAALAGDLSSASYTLSDMAADAAGLLEYLGIPAAHVAGASMGAAIAQTMAIEHPDRVLSLTSMMFTTGNPSVGQMHPDTMAGVFGGPPASTREQVMERALRIHRVVGSPGYPPDPHGAAERAGVAWDRDHDETAIARQGLATVASGDRTLLLRQLRMPALVVHGLADTMCDPSGGRATAAAIPGARLELIEGMGHDLPAALWDRLAGLISSVVEQGEKAARAGALPEGVWRV